MSETLLEVRGLHKSYQSGTRRLQILADLDLDVRGGEAVSIIGDSGVGKTTLLHALGGFEHPDRGSILFGGLALESATTQELATYRNAKIGFVFQFHHLLPEFTALENVEMPFRVGRHRGEARTRARQLLTRLGLAERIHHRPGALSVGEQQRVAIARAVLLEPELVLADEPTGNLDPKTGQQVFSLLRELQAEASFAMVLATHSERLARSCDRLLRLEDGRLRSLEEWEAVEYFKGVGP